MQVTPVVKSLLVVAVEVVVVFHLMISPKLKDIRLKAGKAPLTEQENTCTTKTVTISEYVDTFTRVKCKICGTKKSKGLLRLLLLSLHDLTLLLHAYSNGNFNANKQ